MPADRAILRQAAQNLSKHAGTVPTKHATGKFESTRSSRACKEQSLAQKAQLESDLHSHPATSKRSPRSLPHHHAHRTCPMRRSQRHRSAADLPEPSHSHSHRPCPPTPMLANAQIFNTGADRGKLRPMGPPNLGSAAQRQAAHGYTLHGPGALAAAPVALAHADPEPRAEERRHPPSFKTSNLIQYCLLYTSPSPRDRG